MKVLINTLLIAFLIMACDSSNSSSESGGEESQDSEQRIIEEENIEDTMDDVEEEEEIVEEGVTETVNVSLKLNNGEKWIANAETSEGMLMMQMLLKSFYDMETDSRDYANLANELQYQCDYIINNCSMGGESHEQLHKVLHPILSNIKAAKEAENQGMADVNFITIEDLLNVYFDYFEVKETV